MDEGEHLVSPLLGLDPKVAALDQLEQRIGVAGEAKEPVALGHLLGPAFVFGTEPRNQLVPVEERVAAGAVEALVITLVEVSALGARPPEALHSGAVARIDARPDEVVIRKLQRLP